MYTIPETCVAAVLEAYGEPLQLCEVSAPLVEPREILVKVEMAGVCGADAHQRKGNLTIRSPLPSIPGHETVGLRSYARVGSVPFLVDTSLSQA